MRCAGRGDSGGGEGVEGAGHDEGPCGGGRRPLTGCFDGGARFASSSGGLRRMCGGPLGRVGGLQLVCGGMGHGEKRVPESRNGCEGRCCCSGAVAVAGRVLVGGCGLQVLAVVVVGWIRNIVFGFPVVSYVTHRAGQVLVGSNRDCGPGGRSLERAGGLRGGGLGALAGVHGGRTCNRAC